MSTATGDLDLAALPFDFETVQRSVLALRARIPEDALTAQVLGTDRSGFGVVIDTDLVLTIGYLVADAGDVWLIDERQRAVPAHVLAYDQETGFALVQALAPLSAEPIPLGCSAELAVGDPVIVAGAGDTENAVAAEVIARHEFAGYWEYVLDEALFTAPAHPNWGGTALLGLDGRLYGIGSLGVQTTSGSDETQSANMIVPIDLLVPILGDLRKHGQSRKPVRPWLGWFVQDHESILTIIGLYEGGPAAAAGLQTGDLILEVAGQPTRGLAHLFRTIWSLGPAGVSVPVTYLRGADNHTVEIASADRAALARSGSIH